MFPNFTRGANETGALRIVMKSDGTDVPNTVGIRSLAIDKRTNKIGTAKISIYDGDPADQDFSISSDTLFIPGKIIEIAVGRGDDEDPVFKGIVVKNRIRNRQNGDTLLEVECKDEAVKLTIGRKNAYFTSPSSTILDSKVIGDIIKKAGVSTDFIEPTTTTHQKLVQYFTTDWDFIVSRAEANGKVLLVDDGKVSLRTPSLIGLPKLSLAFGQTLFDFEAEIDARTQFEDVITRSWDPDSNEIVEEKGTPSVLPPGRGGQGDLSSSELSAVIGLEDGFLEQHSGNLTKSEIKAWSSAKLLKSQLSKIRGSFKTTGTAQIKPGDILDLDGLGSRFNGSAYVSGVTHDIYDGVWYTKVRIGLEFDWFAEREVVAEPPRASAMVGGVTGLQIGIIEDYNPQLDSGGAGVFPVRLPLTAETTGGSGDKTVGARMILPDAGANRGFVFHPEPGDEVIVGFLNDDPRDPIILGQVYSGNAPAPIAPTTDNFEKGIITRDQLKVLFNDETKSITLVTPNANTLVISDEEDTISLEDANGNKVLMSADGITLESASDFNIKATGDVNIEGANINIASTSGDVVAEAAANAEVTGGIQTNISGSIVNIN